MQFSSCCMLLLLPPCTNQHWVVGRRQEARGKANAEAEAGFRVDMATTNPAPMASESTQRLQPPRPTQPLEPKAPKTVENGWMFCSAVIGFSPPVQPCKTWSFLHFQASNRASLGKHGSGSILPSFPSNGKAAQGEDQDGVDEWEGLPVTQREPLWVDCTQNLTGNCFTQSAAPSSFRKTN